MSLYTVKIKLVPRYEATFADGSKEVFTRVNEAFGMVELHSVSSRDTMIVEKPSAVTALFCDMMNQSTPVTVYKCSPVMETKLMCRHENPSS